MASFIVKSKNDFKPKSKTICCNSMQEDEIPLELEFDNDDRPITHRQMNGTMIAFNNSQQEISFIEGKKLLDEERSSNHSRSLHA